MKVFTLILFAIFAVLQVEGQQVNPQHTIFNPDRRQLETVLPPEQRLRKQHPYEPMRRQRDEDPNGPWNPPWKPIPTGPWEDKRRQGNDDLLPIKARRQDDGNVQIPARRLNDGNIQIHNNARRQSPPFEPFPPGFPPYDPRRQNPTKKMSKM